MRIIKESNTTPSISETDLENVKRIVPRWGIEKTPLNAVKQTLKEAKS